MPMSDVDNTPQAVWEALKRGNQRFVAAHADGPHRDKQHRNQLRGGQSPRAVVLACSDSRVPVELIFDVGFGDIFVVRTAGEIVDPSVLASVEFATDSLNVDLVVVMGHESCGAVGAARDALDKGSLPDGWRRVLVEKVAPSVLSARHQGLNDTADFEREHVIETISQLRDRLPGLSEQILNGTSGIVGLRYLLADGSVETVTTIGVV